MIIVDTWCEEQAKITGLTSSCISETIVKHLWEITYQTENNPLSGSLCHRQARNMIIGGYQIVFSCESPAGGE